jgi:hypothetical protein
MSIHPIEVRSRMYYYYYENFFQNIFLLDFNWLILSAQYALNLLTFISHAIESIMFRMVNKIKIFYIISNNHK